ncbi:MAG: hypothetical protein HZA80_03600 [Candidatus Taylorbacteria bacterium]|nr:hypothetical protein [Candidatus Taylorbacteria bacterium]
MSVKKLGSTSIDPRVGLSDYLVGVFEGQLNPNPLAQMPDSDFEILLEEPVADETFVDIVKQFFIGNGLIVERKDDTRLPILTARIPSPDLGPETPYVEIALTNRSWQQPPNLKIQALLYGGRVG